MALEYRYQTRQGTQAEWELGNPVLLAGEVAWSTDTDEVRYGNGVDEWSALPIHSTDEAIISRIETAVADSPYLAGVVAAVDLSASNAQISADNALTSENAAVAAAASIGRGQPNGVAPLDGGSRVPDANLPVRLSDASLNNTYGTYVELAKNPDSLVVGAVTGDPITSAVVRWPNGDPGVLTITARHATGAVNAYNITQGSPVAKTYTQPTITRAASGVPTTVPAIVVS